MNLSIYDFNSYKDYILNWIAGHPEGARGQSSKLAKHLGVQNVVVSQTLKGNRNFTLDQMHLCSEHLGLEGDEWHFFMLLFQREKAGHYKLKEKISLELDRLAQNHLTVHRRFKDRKRLSENVSMEFYSNINYSLTRACVAICKDGKTIYNTLEDFGLKEEDISKSLMKLQDMELIKREGDSYLISESGTFLSKESNLYKIYVENLEKLLRNQFIEKYPEENLSYISMMTLSHEVATGIRRRFLDILEEESKKVRESESEELRVLKIDFRRLI